MPTTLEKSRHISILTVTFNHAQEIDACLDAALAQAKDGLEVEVVVVDNASSDGTPERVAARGDVQLIEADVNRGFAAGVNAAFAASTGEWVLFLNPDCVMDPGCAAALRDHLIGDLEVVAAAALLRYPDGTPQMFARRQTDLPTALWAFTQLGRLLDQRLCGGRHRARRRYEDQWSDGPPRNPLVVFCPAAACVMAARRNLEPKPFDERLRLLFNDEDLYIRLTSAGRRIEIVPSAGAAHGYGTSLRRAERADGAGMRAEWVVELRHLAARHWRRRERVALFMLLLAEAAFSAAIGLTGRGRPGYVRGTLGGLGLPGGSPPLISQAGAG